MNITTPEVWLPVTVAEFTPFYQVSNLGRVKSLSRVKRSKAGSTQITQERLRPLRPNSRGYVQVYLYGARADGSYIARNISVHQLVARAFIRNPDGPEEINHINMIKTDNHVTNLEWVSHLDNMLHAQANGSLNPCKRKLTDAEVAAIRTSNLRNHTLAFVHGVNPSTISRIKAGVRRVHR